MIRYRGFAFMILLFVVLSCNNKKQTEMAGKDEYYTCSMDPQVFENKDGNCPICKMKLIKVKINNLKVGQIKLSDQQIKLANITFDTIHSTGINKEITLTGLVTIDQHLVEGISAKVQGRVVKLNLKNVGDYVMKGQHLYDIYSEDLNTAQMEYIHAIHSNYASSNNANAVKNKLILYGMNEKQIAEIKSTRKVIEYVPIYSADEGYLTDLSVTEGAYVSVGTTLFRLASMNSLWVEAQVYLPYLQYLKVGTEANFSIPGASDNLFNGNVIFIDPQVQSPERFVLARFQINNPSQNIKPGMLANIILQTERRKSLTLPVDAVIQDSKGANVWIRNNDGTFENRIVKTGLQNSKNIEIINGLAEGDLVVVSGAYLLNSEYVFKRGLSLK